MERLDSSPPADVLVVVMDCVRASDFPGASTGVKGMPWVNELLEESIVFPNAVTVAPWTIPSHASLLTGRYPWDHGCHARGSLSVPPGVERLPEMLSRKGYATFSLSANPFISPTFDLVRGFQKAAWGGSWESFARLPREAPPLSLEGEQQVRHHWLQRIRQGPLGEMMLKRMDDLYRYPFLLDALNRVAQGIRAPGQAGKVPTSPWIESTFERWITETQRGRPTFTFVNLVDAHEPYYADRAVVRSTSDWFEYARCRQDHLTYAAGGWQITPEQATLLHTLYRGMIESIDRRLARFAEILKRAGRWENTLMILTSDHGQAFGEHGLLFHMFRPDESVLRIPLVVRPPGGGPCRRATGWASLIDVAPTVLSAAGRIPADLPDAIELDSLIDHPRPRPVLAMSDGLVWEHARERFSPERRAMYDRVWGVCYEQDQKVIVDASTGRAQAYNVSSDPDEDRDLWTAGDGRLALMKAAALSVAERIDHGVVKTALSTEVEQQLRSWGY
jgi:arylsulfatase A-like enzyme